MTNEEFEKIVREEIGDRYCVEFVPTDADYQYEVRLVFGKGLAISKGHSDSDIIDFVKMNNDAIDRLMNNALIRYLENRGHKVI